VTLRAWLAVAAVAVIAGLGFEVWHLRRAAYADHLAGLEEAAKRDTTIHYLRDTLEVSRRQAEQLGVSLDQATHDRDEKGTALARLTATFAPIGGKTTGQVTATPPSSSAGGILELHGAFDAWDSAGIRVSAVAQIPVATNGAIGLEAAKGASVAWTWGIERRPLELTVDFSCRRDTALAHVAGPTWASIGISQAVQDPRFCNPPPPAWNPLAIRLPSLTVAGILVGMGVVLDRLFSRSPR